MTIPLIHSRRLFLQTTVFAAAAFSSPGLFAEELVRTTSTSEGPLYPDEMPLDTDNDLLIINDSITPAVGEITHLTGRILNANGQPLRNAFVEIWQCDARGIYHHSRHVDSDGANAQRTFQGYGRFLTDSTGSYYFRTIKPVPYTFRGARRTPHIHIAVSTNGVRIFTSQIFVNGHPMNESDGLVQAIDPKDRKSILIDFKPVSDSKLGELVADFDIVLGATVQESDNGTLMGGIGKPTWDATSFR